MNFRNHTTPENSARRTSAFEVVTLTDTDTEQDDQITRPLAPVADDDGEPNETQAHIARLLAMGFKEYEDLVEKGTNDEL